MFCLVGAYANRNSMSDVWMIVIFGILGYLFEKFRFPISPMVLGAILGPIGETSFMRSMIASNNDWTVFFKGPISGTLMAASVIALSYPLLREFLAARAARAAGRSHRLNASGEPCVAISISMQGPRRRSGAARRRARAQAGRAGDAKASRASTSSAPPRAPSRSSITSPPRPGRSTCSTSSPRSSCRRRPPTGWSTGSSAHGYLSREPGRKRLIVGPRLTNLAFGVLSASMRNDAPHLVLQRLVRTLNETCNIGTLLNGEVIYLDRVEAEHWPLRLHYTSGSRVPLHCSAIGKLFLALAPAPRRQRLLQSLELRRFTDSDHHRTRRSWRANCARSARSMSPSTARNIWSASSAWRCRSLGKNGEMLAALAIQAPEARMNEQTARGHLPALRRAAERTCRNFPVQGLKIGVTVFEEPRGRR